MKKITGFLFIFLLVVSNISAQLEVNDTLLMAFKNDIFWSASSELEQDIYADFGKYGSTNLGDNDPATCWAEGSKHDGSGDFIWLTIPKSTTTIRVRNGYQKNETIFKANNRPKDIEFELYACYEPSGYVTESHNGFFISEKIFSTSAVLEDKLEYQDIKLGFDWPKIHEQLSHDKTFDKDRYILKIKILDVYKGNKWNDACISDINVVPNPYYDITIDEHGLLKVFENKTDTLFYNVENIYQVVDVSLGLNWIIFILMPSDIENSRVETIYKLYSTQKEQFIEINDVFEMYGFVKKSGKLYLEGSDKDFNDFSICLDEL
ncbi:hypothetical protein ACFLSE_08500 [Bacteroidota bacterium]